MGKNVTEKIKKALIRSYPYGDKWTFRKVERLSPGAWYKVGDVLKVKFFATYGAFDYKDRWVNYWDIGQEIPKPLNWKDNARNN